MSSYAPESSGLADDPGLLKGRAPDRPDGNPTGVLPDLTPGATALRAAGAPLTALLSPEDSGAAPRRRAPASGGPGGLPAFDTYDKDRPALDDLVASSGVDTLKSLRHLRHRHTFVHLRLEDARASSASARRGLRFAPCSTGPSPSAGPSRGGGGEPGATPASWAGRPSPCGTASPRADSPSPSTARSESSGDHRGGLAARQGLRGHRPALGDALVDIAHRGDSRTAIRAPACSRARTSRRRAGPPGRSS